MLSVDLIIVPQGAEYQAVKSSLQKWGLGSLEIIAIPIGSGNLPGTLTSHAEKLSRAKHVLLVGLCGSLSQDYDIGDAVAVASCHRLTACHSQNQLQQQVNLDEKLTTQIKQILSVGVVKSLTSDRIITQVGEKEELAQQYGASVVEMEGYHYAELLQHQDISVAMVRVVSDDLRENIPDLSHVVTPEGNLQAIPLAIAMIKQPRSAIRLIRGSLKGLTALKQTMIKLFG